MANFAWLVDELGDITGNRPDANLRLRYLREAGIIGRSAKDRLAPQVEAVQATSALLSNLTVRPQVDAPSDVKKLWRLKLALVQPIYTNHEGSTVQMPAEARSGFFAFGQTVMHLLEEAVSPQELDRARFEQNFKEVMVYRKCETAVILYYDRIEWYYPTTGLSYQNVGQIETKTTATASTVIRLADLVRRSREEATRLNTTIPTDEAWQGLGFTPPLPGPPCAPVTDWSKTDQFAYDYFKAKAAGLPPPAASTLDADQDGQSELSLPGYQPENEQTVEVTHEQSTRRRRSVQRRGDAPVDRTSHSPLRARMRTDEHRPDEQRRDDGADPIAA